MITYRSAEYLCEHRFAHLARHLLLLTALPGHAVWHWMRGAAVTDFHESDWAMLKEAANDLLNNRPDGEQVNWSNPDTGNRGSLIVLATFSHQGQVCRRAAMRNMTFRGRDEKAAYSLCQQEDGELAVRGRECPAAEEEAAS